MERTYSVLVLICIIGTIFCRDWRVQRLNNFQQKYNNSQADIIFLLDVSGSVSNSGFHTEKEFVKSLLSQISVQPIASRVSVVTFGKNVQENIDYIDYPYLDKDKCTFTKEFSRIKHRRAGATNMNGALKNAKSILDGAKSRNLKRSHVNTIVFLLTDGHWNYGGNPSGVARILRDRSKYDVEVFSVGVGYVSQYQLQQISGSKDNVIIARDFSEFASLATRIRGDQIEKLYKTVDSSLCGVQCDPRARCSCGTISGIYTCACPPGHYGSGLPGRCHACPRGTYKTYSSPDPCKPCPVKSVTHKVGSTSIRDCKCMTGYTGAPYAGEQCKPLVCKSLPSTIANGKVSSCGKYYGETCTFMCNKYHHIANEVATTRKLTCTGRNGGTWDKPLPQCVATKCQWPPNPPHMKLHCSGNGVGDKCSYKCNDGYVLIGANERQCREDGQWSHSLPFCQVITCPTVRKIDNVNINPVKCFNQPTNFNDACVYSCKPGFKFVSGDQKRICKSDGTWSGVELKCRDLTPPSITCPEHVTAETEQGQAFKEITYMQPTVRDNSITGRDEITVRQEPASIKSPYEFPIGITLINFTAIDSSGNSDSCTFRVEIQDRELPQFTFCPSDIPAKTSTASDVSKTVKWDQPLYTDNSGKTKLIYSSHNNPSTFPVGPPIHVQYTIEDDSRNRATCEFFIKVEAKTCPKQEPPINGAIGCNFVGGFGHFCTISCQDPYDFNGPKAGGYICTVMGSWATSPPFYPSKWPDCTAMQPQEGMGQNMRFFYYSGSCHDDINARKQIADNFVKILDRILRNEGGCSSAANSRVCKSDNVQIKCGKVQSLNGRRRRSTQNTLTIDIDVEVLSKEDKQAQETVVKALSSTVKKIKQQSNSDAAQLKVIHVNGDTMILDRIEEVGSITGVCNKGMVFDKVDKMVGTTVKTEQTCVSCLAGSYFDTVTNKCKKCPRGTYTESPGLLGCSVCPQGKTTLGEGTSNSTHCKTPCPPGFFSATGLQNCQACKKGYYRSKPYSKSCLKCPGSTTTLGESSTSLARCGMTCPPGTFSKTGVEPCKPCAVGFYQPNAGKKQCIQCSGKMSTHAVGSIQPTQCKVLDNCASKPCLNGGVCTSQYNLFHCVCPTGYYGDRCQDEKNECRDSPCYGDAVCVDKVNGFTCVCPPNYHGRFCSEKRSTCTSASCANGGSCLDTPKGITCSCLPGWQGAFCERKIDECASSPCHNGATCVDSHRGFVCKCKPGFTGALCDENIDDCEQNALCLNGGVCVDGINSFTCSCAQGYGGNRCQMNINECASNPCRNGAICVDEVNGYKCKCAPTFTGVKCEKRQTNSDFDLVFNRAEQGYAETTLNKNLQEVTVAFWVKASSDDIESGTVLSYAVGEDENAMDNALVLRDIHHMLFVVLGEEVETNITAATDTWHHVAVSWSGKSGAYKAYVDGVKVVGGSSLKKGKFIPSGGVFILGQEQDEVGRNFSASEALHGSLSQLNVWDYILSDSDILGLSSYRCDKVKGNVLAWADFYDRVSEQVERKVEFCKVKNTKFTSWMSSTTAAPSHAINAQCLTNDNKNINDLNLINAHCTSVSHGFSCNNADQTKADPSNPTRCPASVKVRYERPFNGARDCNSRTCNGHGSCEETLSGYICLCHDGYTGNNCNKQVPCKAIKSLVNGRVTSSGNTFSFKCDAGYKLSGAASLSCSAGRLNGNVPTCVDVNECLVSNGNCPHKCVNSIGSFHCECNKGFVKSGAYCLDEDECKLNGNCQDSCSNTYGGYKCKCRNGYRVAADQRSCEDVNECSTNKHNCQQICVNTRSSYKCLCRPGFYLAADKTTCIRVSCPSVLAPRDGTVSQGYGTYETRIKYDCNNKYRLNGPKVRTCGADGKWSGAEPKCEAVKCPTLSSPYNGQASVSGQGEGSTYSFSCLTSFLLIGDAKRTCRKDGSWSGKQPRCIPLHCPPLSPPVNGVVIGSSFKLGATVIVKCIEGYMLQEKNNNYRTCQQNKHWSGKQNKCVRVSCPKPEKIGNGTVSGASYNYKDQIKYTCKQGFGLSGPAVRTCMITGDWSGVKPTCLWNSCGYPDSPRNGEVIGKDYSFGRSVSYKCDSGFRLVGDTQRKCLLSGRWTGKTPVCQEISCGDPGLPSNGERRGDKFNVNSVVQFDCLPGFSLVGARSITCKLDGRWSQTKPTCNAGTCGSPKLVGPRGTIHSPNYPNSYANDQYCRWKVVMPTTKQARLAVSTLKTADSDDRLELYDGKDGSLLAVLSGVLPNPVSITSSSNMMDIRFVSDKVNVADGFQAVYESATCGGQITKFGSVIQTPNYPSNYPSGITCVWQIVLPGKDMKLKFEKFHTANIFDKLEAWKSLSVLNSATEIGSYHGNQGSFLVIESYQVMYLKFTSDAAGRTAPGFKATLVKNDDITL